jgi:response regulator RpfG family c-di-GMP phosphodiesterase
VHPRAGRSADECTKKFRAALGLLFQTKKRLVDQEMPRLLIVDDDEATRKLLRVRLADSYDIIDTGNPENALAETLEHKPDAILLDLMMPNFSGFEVCQTLSSLSFTQHIPIFIVSGYGGNSYQAHCRNLGASGYFEKPIDFAQLKARLAAALSTKRPERRDKVRLRLRVALHLRGINEHGMPVEEVANTEDVSANGFLCRCNAALQKGSSVEVFLAGEDQKYVGTARVIWIESENASHPRHGFYFLKKIGEWVLR